MSTEMRYWKRVGFAVSKGQALELIDRLADKPHGSVLDDDLEELDVFNSVATCKSVLFNFVSFNNVV